MLESQLHFLFLQNSNIEDITEDINQKLTITHGSYTIYFRIFKPGCCIGNIDDGVEEFMVSFWLMVVVSLLQGLLA